ncbi:MAG: alkaline phosphatase D family protein [Verrucomicrobiota bacterium]
MTPSLAAKASLFFCLLLAPLVQAVEPVTKIAFGSCAKESRPSPIFAAINDFGPDVWIWMGDNIYGDTSDMTIMKEKWDRQKNGEGYSRLRESSIVIGTWDDHDFGKNDAGKEFAAKAESQQCFLDFLDVPADDPRRERQGVYASHTFGEGDRQVKVILMDTRYHRDLPSEDGDILGEEQWSWLEEELTSSKAPVNLLVSSIQTVPSEHRFEKWAEFPKAKDRLFALLSRDDVPPVTILSGDRHLAEISVEKEDVNYPLYDITSSSLNAAFGGNREEPNKRRIGENFRGTNFGTLEIDWDATPPNLKFAIRDEQGVAVREVELAQKR